MDSRIIGKIMCVMSFEAEVSKMNLVAATKGFSLKKKKKKKKKKKLRKKKKKKVKENKNKEIPIFS